MHVSRQRHLAVFTELQDRDIFLHPIYKSGDPNQEGEKGRAVNIDTNRLSPEQKKLYDLGFQTYAFNQYASDLISVHRTLPDVVDKQGRNRKIRDFSVTPIRDNNTLRLEFTL
ncbi:hypothetical protein ANCCAN_19530 [Ancylostoma caninum]|uniref:Uncharacterized protein n=1 Tax=Ancylostoma caninum TaxID=29170 RepID=A0A368FT03_ANCCA|nr:hypothetical protein ANCCAN_19530 [Ancylostoma caninum]